MSIARSLLWIKFTVFLTDHTLEIDVRIPWLGITQESFLDLFQSRASCLWKPEKDVFFAQYAV